jgi:hypothetical protein
MLRCETGATLVLKLASDTLPAEGTENPGARQGMPIVPVGRVNFVQSLLVKGN